MATITYSWENVVGSSFVNGSLTTGNQDEAAVAAINGGAGYFVAWTDPTPDDSVQGRIIGSNGTPSGVQFPVSSTTTNSQSDASVARLAGGNVVVTFTDTSTDPGGDIRARLFTSAGVPVAADFAIATSTADDSQSDVAALANGSFVVSWTRDFGGGDKDIVAQIFNASGSPTSVQISVDSSITLNTSASQVIGLTNGNFVVVWQQQPAAGGDSEVWFRIYDNTGAAVTASTLVDDIGSINEDPQIVALKDGSFAIAYTDNGWGIDGTEITARIFNPNGSVRSAYLRANTQTTGDQSKPSVTAMGNGYNSYLLVSWSDGETTYYQAYDTQGNAIGTNYAAVGGVVEAEVAGLTGGLVANVRTSIVPDDGADQSIRTSIDELTRTTTGDAGLDSLSGDGLRDTIFGLDGNDFLYGMDGNDVLDGGANNDQLNGGIGVDTASYATAAAGVDVTLATIAAQDTVGAGTDTLISIENLTGSDFDDTLAGNTNANVLRGGGGGDSLNGNAGSDKMIGGTGDDTYYVAQAGDTVDESDGDGIDTVFSSVSFSLVNGPRVLGDLEKLTLTGSANINGTGNAFDNVINGNSGNNTLAGNDGADTLNGGAGIDKMIGGNGNDTSIVDNAGDKVDESGGSGIDTVKSSITFSLADAVHAIGDIEKLTLTGSANIDGTGNALDNTITGNSGNNTLIGNDGLDTLNGGSSDDALNGGLGSDKLNGGDGVDSLLGGVDSDSLTGGLNADTFVYLTLDDSTVAAAGRDIVQDFSHAEGDLIDVSAIDADTVTAGNQAFTFIGAVAFSGTAGELRSVVTGSSSIVSGDVNGDAVADFAILVKGITPLQASDFTV